VGARGSPGRNGIEPRRQTPLSPCRAQQSSKSRRSIVKLALVYYRKPGRFTKYVFNPVVAAMTRAGISVWGSRVLRVRGRKSGEWRSAPVNLLTYQGSRYLVAPRGLTQWVRNLREAGGGGLILGSPIERFCPHEIPGAHNIPILPAPLKRWKAEVGPF